MQNYAVAESAEHAAALLGKNRRNYILGGALWLRLGRGRIGTAVDISRLGLDTITEKDDAFVIGAMTPLRALETHQGLRACFGSLLADALRPIVGVQFRNSATVGGSIFGRFGFSDVLTALLALDTTVYLYHGGAMPLETFAQMPYEKDLLTHIAIAKTPTDSVYFSQRLSATDFPLITVCAAQSNDALKVTVGARPGRAKVALQEKAACLAALTPEGAAALAKETAAGLSYGSNMRASAQYRAHLAEILIKRSFNKLARQEEVLCKSN